MFKENSKAIYLQIADRICDSILSGELTDDSRLPSVREYAAQVQVNPNTMMRTYEHLSARVVLYNRRGIGFFVTPGAAVVIGEMRKEQLLDGELSDMFRQLALLGIDADTLAERYREFLKNEDTCKPQSK